MKVELWYDPVHTETGVRLNGYWQEQQDIYSFLYSVRRYPLQAWLEPDGSWTGLRQQIMDISRGEAVELIFYGRRMDFDDVVLALRDMDIRLCHCPWNSEEGYAGQEGEAETLLRAISQDAPSHLQIDTALKMEKVSQDSWYLAVETEEELRQAERAEEPCILVQEVLLDSYDKLPRLGKLTRSLHRPAQAVCCCVKSQERRQEFVRYAKQFPRYGFTFIGADEKMPPEFLQEKYGRPYLIRKTQECYREIGNRMDRLIAELKSENMDIRTQELIYREQQGTLTHEDRQELASLQGFKAWIARNESTGGKYRTLADFRAISQCGEEGKV